MSRVPKRIWLSLKILGPSFIFYASNAHKGGGTLHIRSDSKTNFEQIYWLALILEMFKVGQVDFGRNVLILHTFLLILLCIYHVNQCKSVQFDKNQVVQLCTAPKSSLTNIFLRYFFWSASNFSDLKRQRIHSDRNIAPESLSGRKLHQLGSDQVTLHIPCSFPDLSTVFDDEASIQVPLAGLPDL